MCTTREGEGKGREGGLVTNLALQASLPRQIQCPLCTSYRCQSGGGESYITSSNVLHNVMR